MKRIIKIFIILILILAGKMPGQIGSWQVIGKMPVGLAGSEAVVIDSTIYFLGGYSDSLQNYTDWIYSFKPSTFQWSYLGQMKKKRKSFLADHIGSKIYYFGGDETTTQSYAEGLLEVFDTKSGVASYADTNKYFNRTNLTGEISDSVFYIVGGLLYNKPNETEQVNIFSYNVNTKQVINKLTYPFNQLSYKGQMSAKMGNNIFIFGGVYYSMLKEIDFYNVLNNYESDTKWSLGESRSNGRAVKLGQSNKVMLLGGFNDSAKALNSAEIYTIKDTISSPQLSMAAYMKYKRKDCMAVYYDNCVYVFGGTDETGRVIYDVEKFDLSVLTVDNIQNTPVTGYKLAQNYPNPFNPLTNIVYSVPVKSFVTIKVYDVLGHLIATLLNTEKQAGSYNVRFDASGLSSGIYFYQINAVSLSKNNYGSTGSPDFMETRKMVVIK